MTKVLFHCGTTQPWFDLQRNAWFDCEIGLWPFVAKEPAKRTSVNRPKGTLVTKPQNVNCEVYNKQMMMEKVLLPAIHNKWLKGADLGPSPGGEIIIQQEDNAKPHKLTIRADIAT